MPVGIHIRAQDLSAFYSRILLIWACTQNSRVTDLCIALLLFLNSSYIIKHFAGIVVSVQIVCSFILCATNINKQQKRNKGGLQKPV